ncbi:TetR/AcrR family transcriptional regulator [Brevibacterium otitidis]|uniref:TetR/AcrR family transcriptional regulator n=1 Tax=Brevibacterium otitidis TaxID=53364 RepID=A0ABV5X303_9MICO|nr:hypothetical protein GCM10023233_09250 [Brevibacterium otitidis]
MTVQRQPGAPLTERGRRTRRALINAAIDVFCEHGYLTTPLSAITERVGCSTGTLYTYFANRQEILAAIIEDSYAPVVAADHAWISPDHEAGAEAPGPEALVAKIRKATEVYVRRYRDNAREVALMDQAAAVDPEVRDIRIARNRVFYRRNRRSIEQMQAAGHIPAELDPDLTAKALSAMVSRTCRSIFVDEPEQRYLSDAGVEELAEKLSQLWVSALGLAPAGGSG